MTTVIIEARHLSLLRPDGDSRLEKQFDRRLTELEQQANTWDTLCKVHVPDELSEEVIKKLHEDGVSFIVEGREDA